MAPVALPPGRRCARTYQPAARSGNDPRHCLENVRRVGYTDAMTAAIPRAWTAELRATLALAAPLVLTNLGQIAITTTDVIMIGALGPGALAAAALGTALFFIVIIFGMGVVAAVAPLVAQARGRGQAVPSEVRRTVQQGLWAATIIALPGMLLLGHSGPGLLAFGLEPGLVAECDAYLATLLWSLAPQLWFIVLRTFLAALERPRPAAVISGVAILVNGAACWTLIHGLGPVPSLGIAGAGVASTIASLFMAGAQVGFILVDRRARHYRVLGALWRPDPERLAEVFRIGAPIGLMLVLELTLFSGAALIVGLFGAGTLAAHQIALQCASVTFMVPMGIGQAATVRVALAAGRGDIAGAARAGWVALAMGVAFMSVAALVFLLMPDLLVGIFLDRTEPRSPEWDLALRFLFLAALFQIVDGCQSIAAGALRGLKDTRVPMLIAGLGYWGIGLGVGVGLAFPGGLEGEGIWIGFCAGLGVVAVLLMLRFGDRVARLRQHRPALAT